MNLIQEYLYDHWNNEGVIEELHTIEEALEDKLSHEESLEIPLAVEYFMQHIRPEEGQIKYKKWGNEDG